MSEKFYLGETVKFVAIVGSIPTEVLITVVDPAGVDKVTLSVMTEEADGVYVYYYASSEEDLAGKYTFRVTASNSLGKSIDEYNVELYEQR